MKTIYEKLKSAGIKIDNHYSDLYFELSQNAIQIIKTHNHDEQDCIKFSTFRNQIDGKSWGEIPFAFDPWWNAREVKS